MADQTNLLALNATIEAARAGDAGHWVSALCPQVVQQHVGEQGKGGRHVLVAVE